MHSQNLFAPASVQSSVPDSHAVFCAWRRHTLQAFRSWLLTAPTPADVICELDGTVNALKLMAELHQPGAVQREV